MGAVPEAPVRLLILEGLQQEIESVETLRDHGEVAPYGLALLDEHELIECIRALLHEGLIEAWEERLPGAALERVEPTTPVAIDEPTLRRCWFKLAPAGQAAYRAGKPELATYWDAHPT